MGGRDYFLFKNLGYEVVAVDLGPQPDIEPVVIWNVEDELPFPEQSFDAIIATEVLEHLVRDATALGNMRRLLKDRGKLVVSFPYYTDWEEGHVRIHSPISAKVLLQVSGFRVEDRVERPGLLRPGRVNMAAHAISAISYRLRGKTAYKAITELGGRIEYHCGHIKWLRPFRKLSRHFGAYYLCTKGEVLDYVTLNADLYTASNNQRASA